MNLSIVVPAYNEEHNIFHCLKAIYAQKESNANFEVIIVDDCSHDQTANKIKRFKRRYNISNLKIIQNEVNKGRFESRIIGINHCKHELIFFVDAKVKLHKDAIKTLIRLRYEPVVATNTYPGDQSIIERTFFLIRRAVYKGNYPKMKNKSTFLTSDNFDCLPKGTTAFACSKSILLNSLPKNTDKHSSDDTAWLRNITKIKPILICNELEFTYNPRKKLRNIMTHLYQRGPKFVDYYYQSGRRFYKNLNIAILILLASTAYMIKTPESSIFFFYGLLIANTIISIKLSEKPIDVPKLFFALPLITAAFSLGVAYGLLLKATKILTRL